MRAVQALEPTRYEKRFDDPGYGWFTIVLDADNILHMTIYGRGTVHGTQALVRMLEEVVALREPGERVDAFINLTDLSKTPLRSQLILGKWFVTRRHLVDRVAIFGAKPWETKLAKAVMKIARFERAAFFTTSGQASGWLRPGSA